MAVIEQFVIPGWREPRGYSHVVRAEGSTQLHLCGLAAVNNDGKAVFSDDLAAQTEYVIDKIEGALGTFGVGLEAVVRRVTYVVDLTEARMREVQEVYLRRFAELSRPAGTAVGVTGLAVAGAAIEIECTAVLGEQ